MSEIRKIRVGIIGCGAIGTLISEAFKQKIVACDEIIFYDHDKKKAEKLRSSIHFPAMVVESIEELLSLKPQIILEAASQQAVRAYAERIVAEDVDFIVMSTGALLNLNLQSNNVHVPSGAIGGIDALSSATLAGIQEIVLTSRKNPKALNMHNKKAEKIFEGYAEEAAQLYPREMNVAATLALTVKPAKVRVNIISDPSVKRNTHEFKVKWKFGEMFFRFENDPHPANPRTSALAAWSAIKLLQNLLRT